MKARLKNNDHVLVPDNDNHYVGAQKNKLHRSVGQDPIYEARRGILDTTNHEEKLYQIWENDQCIDRKKPNHDVCEERVVFLTMITCKVITYKINLHLKPIGRNVQDPRKPGAAKVVHAKKEEESGQKGEHSH